MHQSAKDVIIAIGQSVQKAGTTLAYAESTAGHKRKANGVMAALNLVNEDAHRRASYFEAMAAPPVGEMLVAVACDLATEIDRHLKNLADAVRVEGRRKRASGIEAVRAIVSEKAHEMVLDLRAGRIMSDSPIVKNERAIFDAIRRIGSGHGLDGDASTLVDALRDLLALDARAVAAARAGAKNFDTSARTN
jgi:hypothetical protein